MATASELRIYKQLDSLAKDIRDRDIRFHERLDILVAVESTMKSDLAVVAAGCLECRPKVLGSGDKDGLDTRIDRLERDSRRYSKWFWVVMVCLSSIIAAVVSSAMGR